VNDNEAGNGDYKIIVIMLAAEHRLVGRGDKECCMFPRTEYHWLMDLELLERAPAKHSSNFTLRN
jgi:hypothetical protein